VKALVYTHPEELTYRDEPDPELHSGDALLRVDAVGICGSDMHAYLGHDERRIAPLILGHEAAGTIVEGRDKGRRVIVNPLVTCGHCPACERGRSHLCAERQIISMAPRQGAFAELLSIPERNLVSVPDGMDITTAALAEPIATGWHAVKIAARVGDEALADSRVLVFGGGAVGFAAALSVKAHGCRDILLAETNALRRNTVERAAICTVFDPLTDKIVDDSSIDVVIDCVGGKATRAGAIAAIRPGGVVVHVGLMDRVDGMDVRKLTLQEVAFIGSYTYTMADFQETIAAMHSGSLGALDWFEERALSEGATAFGDLLAGRSASAKIVLRP
jgi:threonine dehydrogenase-like Zn-dependent dehydrogenase